MGWFGSSGGSSSKSSVTNTSTTVDPNEISLVEGGFHATEAAQKVPVKYSATTGSSPSTNAQPAGTTPVTTTGGSVANSSGTSLPTATILPNGQPYDFNQTLASTYFTQGTDRTRALIYSPSNQIHRWCAYLFGVAAYGFGSAMHVFGQGTALTTLTMSAAGTCFFLNAQNRQVNGPTKDIFWFECLGSWLWVMASFQQFSTIKKMKYAGYSSWSGLFLTVYYSTRYLVALQKDDGDE